MLSIESLALPELRHIDLAKKVIVIGQAFNASGKYLDSDALPGLTKKDAIRIYSLLPKIALKDAAPASEEMSKVTKELPDSHFLSGVWLLSWEKNGQYSSILKSMDSKEAESKAWVARLLYSCCEYMSAHCDDIRISSQSAPSAWLLCEASSSFYDLFMRLAKIMAESSTEFEQGIFKPYVQAVKVWGRE